MKTVEELLNFGVAVVDKPRGPTSHQVSAWVREILHVQKTGHAGTLDPKVTGVLPIGINRATKVINLLHLVPKEYIGVLRLHGDFSEEKLRKTMGDFVGEVYQVPPVRSAVARKLRKRKIYEIEIIDILDRDVLFRAKVESGTYIRTLCNDVGDALCIGGHMEDLRRIATGHFTEDDAHTLQDILDAYVFWKEDGDESYIREVIKPGEEIVSFLPRIVVRDSAVDALAHGAPLYKPGVKEMGKVEKGEYVALYTEKGELVSISVALLEDEVIAAPYRVIMEPGRYPKGWKGP